MKLATTTKTIAAFDRTIQLHDEANNPQTITAMRKLLTKCHLRYQDARGRFIILNAYIGRSIREELTAAVSKWSTANHIQINF